MTSCSPGVQQYKNSIFSHFKQPGQAIVVADFKANLSLSGAEEETDDVYFKTPQTSLSLLNQLNPTSGGRCFLPIFLFD
jgi:hypothetical protein